jgi:Nucleotidyltransferase domain
MDSDEAFDHFSKAIESDPLDVLLARWRRDTFTARLRKLPGVAKVIHSGSLARGTNVGGIHDVDLIVVFDAKALPDPNLGSGSALAALKHMQTGIDQRLGTGQGPATRVISGTSLRHHVVRCQDVSLGPLDGIIPSAPPVDVMPAIREGAHLRIPELHKDRWAHADPEKLIRLVEERKREWKYFDEVVRMVKVWAEHSHLKMRSLAIEVMVLQYLPRPRFFETLSCSEAVARFFEAAARADITKLSDPAGRCGEIDPGINYSALQRELRKAAGLARRARNAERAIENPVAVAIPENPNSLWRQIFGRKYPYSRKRYWHPQYFEPMTCEKPPSRKRPADFTDPGEWAGPRPPREGPDEYSGGPSEPPFPGPPSPPRPSPRTPEGSGPTGLNLSGGGGGHAPPTRAGEPQLDRWERVFGPGTAAGVPAITFG